MCITESFYCTAVWHNPVITTILQFKNFLIKKKRNQKKKSNQEQRPLATPHQVTAFPAQSTIWGAHYTSRHCFGFRSAALRCQFAKEPQKLIFNRITPQYHGPSGGFLLIYTYLNMETHQTKFVIGESPFPCVLRTTRVCSRECPTQTVISAWTLPGDCSQAPRHTPKGIRLL